MRAMTVRPERLGSALVMIGISFLLLGCGLLPQAAPKVCDPAARTELLKARLEPWVTSAPFTVQRSSAAWLQVTTLPAASEGLFGSIAGIAELHSIPAGASPVYDADHLPTDPAINVMKALTWQELSLGPGAWQLYSMSDPGIEVVSCPKS